MNISELNVTDICNYRYYFLDTNIWIFYLKYIQGDVDSTADNYISFIERIVGHNESIALLPAKVKKKSVNIKFVMTGNLLSEILNTSLREICMKNFFGKSYIQMNFKNDYRNNVKSDYSVQLNILKDDIKAYSEHIESFSDNFDKKSYKEYLDLLNENSDFNDAMFIEFVKEHNLENPDNKICIITHDSDFYFEDIPIQTCNKKLLRHSK